MRLKVLVSALVLAIGISMAAVASAGKIGNGSTMGTGVVFASNPVQSLGLEGLTDQKDADSAVPPAAYHTVPLTNLDGSGFLRGEYADVYSSTGNLAFSPSNVFAYTRSQDEFEQVMAYYWITQAQRYIHSLGFGVNRRSINNRPQAVRINQWGVDNSFATDHPKNELRFGKGGVDDAEDAEVILHEYGHAIHFSQNFSFASEEAGAISEGFGDYWAVTVSDVVDRSLHVDQLEPLPCVADWDSTSYTSSVPHCLRRVDSNLTYPGGLNGEVHHDGQIWSRALWDIRGALGNEQADTIILQGSFDFPGTSMPDLANRTVAAADGLYHNAAVTAAVRLAFVNRGILH
jgi:zinc metalloprotease ZmpB